MTSQSHNGGAQTGEIFKTSNGGTSWTSQSSGQQALRAIAVFDANTLWAVGDAGTILKTTNGGTTWTAQNSGTTNILHGVTAVSATTAWAVGASGTIFKTTDGGGTWVAQASGVTSTLLGIDAVDETTVRVAGSFRVLKTTDGGATWVQQTVTPDETFNGVAAFGQDTAWIVGNNGAIRHTGPLLPAAPSNIAATADDGNATVSFTPPTDDGGSAITSYTVTSSPGGKTATGSASPLTVTGLTNGVTSYTFTVTATNGVGTGPASTASIAVTPASAPAAFSVNLLVNSGADAGAAAISDTQTVAPPGWTVSGGLTAVLYGTSGGFPSISSLGPSDRGANFFASAVAQASSTATQTVGVSSLQGTIDANGASFALSGYLGGYQNQSDNARLTATFKSAAGPRWPRRSPSARCWQRTAATSPACSPAAPPGRYRR